MSRCRPQWYLSFTGIKIFAHGGKDGHPYPVDRDTFDHSISTLKEAVENAKLDKGEKYDAIKRLNRYIGEDP